LKLYSISYSVSRGLSFFRENYLLLIMEKPLSMSSLPQMGSKKGLRDLDLFTLPV